MGGESLGITITVVVVVALVRGEVELWWQWWLLSVGDGGWGDRDNEGV